MFPAWRPASWYPSARFTLRDDQGNICSSSQPASEESHILPTEMPNRPQLQRKIKQMDLTKQE